MNNDSPDTMSMDETQWAATHVDDVFLPSVRVQLGWREVETAVTQGAIVPQQAHALWAGWASATSGLRVGAKGVARAFEATLAESARETPVPRPAVSGALQPYGLLLGLLAGAVLGAAFTYFVLRG